jgi:hypothetical protein
MGSIGVRHPRTRSRIGAVESLRGSKRDEFRRRAALPVRSVPAMFGRIGGEAMIASALSGLYRSMIVRKSVTLLTGMALALLLVAYMPPETIPAMRNEVVTTLLLAVLGVGGTASVRMSKQNETYKSLTPGVNKSVEREP